MRYFNIMVGLRGCYMPDTVYVIACHTRRELKAFIASEADNVDSGDMVGLSKRAIAWIAATAWKDSARKHGQASLPFCLPYGHKPDRIGESADYHYGIMVGHATRGEYLEYQKDN